jgi:hypothetical protein
MRSLVRRARPGREMGEITEVEKCESGRDQRRGSGYSCIMHGVRAAAAQVRAELSLA